MRRRWRDAPLDAIFAFVFLAAFPRLAYRLRWPTRAGPRGVVSYVVSLTALNFGIRQWLIPGMRAVQEEAARTRDALRQELGREPTEDELMARLIERRRLARG